MKQTNGKKVNVALMVALTGFIVALAAACAACLVEVKDMLAYTMVSIVAATVAAVALQTYDLLRKDDETGANAQRSSDNGNENTKGRADWITRNA